MIGILGGTFDPVHHGHLRLALELHAALGLDRVHLVPAFEPVHRERPAAGPAHRLAMLRAALAGVTELVLDDREIRRAGPSFTIDTLNAVRADFPSEPVVLAIGMDQLVALHTWHRWTELTDLAHLAVAARPGACRPSSGPVGELLRARGRDDVQAVKERPAGWIVPLPMPCLEISSSRIRSLVARAISPRFLLPPAVLDYIEREELYRHAQ